jgi:hypothetical protein
MFDFLLQYSVPLVIHTKITSNYKNYTITQKLPNEVNIALNSKQNIYIALKIILKL